MSKRVTKEEVLAALEPLEPLPEGVALPAAGEHQARLIVALHEADQVAERLSLLARAGDLDAIVQLEREMERREMERPPGYPFHLVEQARAVGDRTRQLCPPEKVEHRALVSYFDLAVMQGHLRREDWWHTANGGLRGKASAGQAKGDGQLAGVADFIICHPFNAWPWVGTGVAIELKRTQRSRSKVSPEQEVWLARRRLLGWVAEVCWGAAEAWALLELVYGWMASR